MPRRSKSKIIVEVRTGPIQWMFLQGGFSTMAEAEKWVEKDIKKGQTLRVAKVSGIFTTKTTVIKR